MLVEIGADGFDDRLRHFSSTRAVAQPPMEQWAEATASGHHQEFGPVACGEICNTGRIHDSGSRHLQEPLLQSSCHCSTPAVSESRTIASGPHRTRRAARNALPFVAMHYSIVEAAIVDPDIHHLPAESAAELKWPH